MIFRNKTTRTEKTIPETPCVHSHEIHTSRYSSLHGRTLQPAQTTTREVTDRTAEERKKNLLKAINLLKPSSPSLLSIAGQRDLAAEGGGAGQGADSETNEICYRVPSLAPAYIPPLSRGS